LEVVVLNEHGLGEFLRRQNVEWLRAVHEWKVEKLKPALLIK